MSGQKISEVIARLEKAKAEHGDLPVYIDYDSSWQSVGDYYFVVKKDSEGEVLLIIIEV